MTSDSLHIVICGFPRSGSTLLYNMMLTSSNPENDLYFWGGEKRALSVVGKQWRQISKFPSDLFFIPTIQQECEEQGIEPRFVLTIRDPRGVLTSVHANSEGQYKVGWDYALGTNVNGLTGGKTEGLLTYIQELKKYPDILTIRYEDLISKPNEIQEIIGDYLNLSWNTNFNTFHKRIIPKGLHHQMNGVRELDKSRIDGWRDHPERIKEQFERCPALFDALIDLGYEEDNEWIKNL